MPRWLAGVSALALLCYPFFIYFGLEQFGLPAIGILLIVLFVLRISLGNQSRIEELKQLARLTGVTGVGLILLGILFDSHGWLTFYPVVVNLGMLVLFGYSLRQPRTIIERLARLQEPDLPASGVRYTRTVTKVWCGYFIINGSIALYTCFQPLATWTLYNGLISYLLAGALFFIEWIVRQYVRRHAQ
ncbi:hypothetical protein [Vibrio sp.]|uniref:COG4648 family protein n=1 Tax=Vibrio sp. TaxID=678 RepID=UPI003D1255E8